MKEKLRKRVSSFDFLEFLPDVCFILVLITFITFQLHLHRGNGKKFMTTILANHNLPDEYGGTGGPIADLISRTFTNSKLD